MSLLNSGGSPHVGSDPSDYFNQGAFAEPEERVEPSGHDQQQQDEVTARDPSPAAGQIESKKRPREPSPVPSPSALPPAQRPTSSSSASSAPPLPPSAPPVQQQPQYETRALEPSLFMVEPIDEFTREVADWLWGFASVEDWNMVEIEAKIGILLDNRVKRKERINLPVPIETIVTDDSFIRFESNMTIRQHKGYNVLLNSRVQDTASPAYPYAPIRYSHVKERDSFYTVDAPTGGRKKIRVTTDQKDNRELRTVEKVRIADMNIFSPKRGFDWRISVNLETPARSPPSHLKPALSRNKDRISYTHQLFQVDLTQVTSGADGPVHELEIEFKDTKVLLAEGRKEQRGEENRYLEMVQCFLNNVRMLIRNADDP
ncbi:mRNA triphosphatase CET1 [Meredithblackwellia eburnea MCA 4105]